MKEEIPIEIFNKIVDVLCNFDFEKASEILKTFTNEGDKYETNELRFFVKEQLLYIYRKAIEQNSTYYYCSTGFFRFEYNDGDFRIALELVDWDTSY